MSDLERRLSDALRPPRRRPEADIQRAILARAAQIPGVYIYRINVAVARTARRCVRSAPTGHADLVACVWGYYVAIEVKSPRGRQSAAQLEWAHQVGRAGGRYLLATSVDSAIEYLTCLSVRFHPPPAP